MDSEKEPPRQTETCLSFRSGARASVGCLLVQAAFLLPHPVRVTRAFPLSFMAPGMATPGVHGLSLFSLESTSRGNGIKMHFPDSRKSLPAH